MAAAGCGFRPVYGDRGVAGAGRAGSELAAISVDLIPERAGQLLRGALQERFERFNPDQPRRYALRADFAVTDDALSIQADSSITRLRVIGLSRYTLTTLDSRATLTSGTARAVDGLDVINQQYFAADLTQEVVVRRLADAVADQVALQLAVFFSAHTGV